MSLIRPELARRFARWREVAAISTPARSAGHPRRFARWREVAAAVLTGLAGLWLFSLGGWLLQALGAVVCLAALGWAVIAWRRMRFLRGIAAPGVVEVDEGQVGYFGPSFGGFVALADLVEVRLAELHGTRQWRLRTAAGEVLLIPVDAAGAEKLYDAFATLPGVDMAAMAAALDHGAATLPLWRRAAPSLARR